jgi:hypothetical protein
MESDLLSFVMADRSPIDFFDRRSTRESRVSRGGMYSPENVHDSSGLIMNIDLNVRYSFSARGANLGKTQEDNDDERRCLGDFHICPSSVPGVNKNPGRCIYDHPWPLNLRLKLAQKEKGSW